MTIPAEILFDRLLRQSGSFEGKQDLAKLPALQCELLSNLQESLNEALRNEKKDVPENVDHPPFHFDYIASETPNAIAFTSESHSFIGITMGLIYELWDVCDRLSKSGPLKRSLGLDGLDDWERLHVVLFRIQLFFVAGHEYTHHVHGDLKGVFTGEFFGSINSGTIAATKQQKSTRSALGNSSAQLGEGRPHAVDLLGIVDLPELVAACDDVVRAKPRFTRSMDDAG